jgi:ribonuclease D
LGKFAQDHNIPVENLLSPDFLRRMLWTPPAEPSLESISAALLKLGARPWQVEIAGPVVQAAIDLPVTAGVTSEVTDG